MKITATSLNADGTGPVAIIITDGANSARLVVPQILSAQAANDNQDAAQTTEERPKLTDIAAVLDVVNRIPASSLGAFETDISHYEGPMVPPAFRGDGLLGD
jgi:hypothetical protein